MGLDYMVKGNFWGFRDMSGREVEGEGGSGLEGLVCGLMIMRSSW